jgi:hypothetical protein
MQLTRILVGAGLAVGMLLPVASAQTDRAAAPAESRVEVNFIEPERFTDLRSTYSYKGADEGYMNELRRHLVRTASERLPQGYRLQVNITDVDMAGDFEPHRGATFMDTRIVREIYPPRIRLNYQLMDAAGNVVTEGEQRLQDLGFTHQIDPINRSDPLRHEKRLLSDWVRQLNRNIARR